MTTWSKEIEILVLLPCGRLVAWRSARLVEGALIAARFGPLQLDEIIDERIAERATEQRPLVQRVERLRQAFRQARTFGRIGLVVRRRRLRVRLDAGKSGHDLRQDIEIGIGGRLADPV